MQFESFEQARDWVAQQTSIPDRKIKGRDLGERHSSSEGFVHPLVSFSYTLHRDDVVEIIADWNVCPECKQLRNSKLAVLDTPNRQSYTKYFVRHGKKNVL